MFYCFYYSSTRDEISATNNIANLIKEKLLLNEIEKYNEKQIDELNNYLYSYKFYKKLFDGFKYCKDKNICFTVYLTRNDFNCNYLFETDREKTWEIIEKYLNNKGFKTTRTNPYELAVYL